MPEILCNWIFFFDNIISYIFYSCLKITLIVICLVKYKFIAMKAT